MDQQTFGIIDPIRSVKMPSTVRGHDVRVAGDSPMHRRKKPMRRIDGHRWN